jgi:DsbC/DsbD-like thiol-disulfide interchange protein
MKRALVRCLLAGAVAASAAVCAWPQQDNPLGETRSKRQWVSLAAPPAVTVTPGKTSVATLQFQVSAGNHINSNKPGSELLIPTKLTLGAAKGITVGKVGYPPGHELAFDFAPDEKLNVYTGSFAVQVPLRAAASTPVGPVALRGELLYQACNDRSCFPPSHLPVEFEVKVLGTKKAQTSR